MVVPFTSYISNYMQHSPVTGKSFIRAQMLDLRRHVLPDIALAAGKAVAEYLLDTIPVGVIVAGYLPMRGELDIHYALTALAGRGHILCLPVVEHIDKPLYFRQWAPGDPLQKGQYNIDIPMIQARVIRPEILLVPLVAFDRKGNRLGYGAGYYDRTLERLRKEGGLAEAIGVAYGFQEVVSIAPEAHDQRLEFIVTEKGVIRDV